ncbi:MAG: hypothetical protein KIS85_07480 [Anaerolineales bacterium]|nr:hypothetical protein [Anaerolineales bacterium]
MKKPSPKRKHSEAALQQSWQSVETRLRGAAQAAPRRGFANRWLANWQLEEQRIRRRRQRWLLAANGLVWLLFFAPPAWALWNALSQPAATFTAAVAYLAQATAFGWTLLRVLTSVLSATPLPLWVATSASLLGLLAVWAMLFQQGSYKKELG